MLVGLKVTNGVITQYYGNGGDLVIPSEQGITSIGINAFYGCGNLTSITIPTGVIRHWFICFLRL
ncbi:hypothetical protein MASR1M31_21660 [Porphyromonadaceae bacterium]